MRKLRRSLIVGVAMAAALSGRWATRIFAADSGPHGSGTNPYAVVAVHLRGDGTTSERDDVLARVAALQKIYGFSWDGSLFRDQGPDSFAARISLRRDDIAAFAREAGVVKIESLSGYAF